MRDLSGHTPGLRFHEPPAGVTIAGLHEVGAYALGIRFSDGHDNGIYTWPHLRWIAAYGQG
ncbi:gamma-butyrobetaine hydroxylase-like domain-containing protein [Nannocystis pusilla]|uniref:gamma-butyrobetaine hydroxylase-like domain-containing protein n=1 Tax=Nannocystis pusilla TaxID=889268 RepID=UPI003B7DD1AC